MSKKLYVEPQGFKVEGGVLKKFDVKYGKWNRCGVFENVEGTLYYVTRKREILRIHHSLGVSRDILKFLSKQPSQPVVKFLLGYRKPYDVYVIPVSVLLKRGIAVFCSNDNTTSLHLPLDKLICKKRQRKLF